MGVKYRVTVTDGSSSCVVGVYDTRDEAVEHAINKCKDSYCLDNEEERRNALKFQDFYIVGCGPSKILIDEV